MATFYKIALEAVSSGQNVINVLYYGDATAADVPFDPAIMGALALDVWGVVDGPLLALVGTTYQAQRAVVTVVNERNEVQSPYEVEVSISGTGTGSGSVESPALAYIIGFRVGTYAKEPQPRVPRRSYLAVGPVPSGLVLDTGAVTASTAAQEALEDALSQDVTSGSNIYEPVRVGVVNAANEPAVGEVVDALFRPFVSFRRSRLFTPQGLA